MEGARQTDGFMVLSGGMFSSGDNPHLTGPDQADALVNATVRRGWAEPRPRFKRVDVVWEDRLAQQAFENGAVQGAARYDSDEGPRVVYAADGRLISFDPVAGTAALLRPGGVTRPFLQSAPFVYLQQRGRWLVAQDGLNTPVIVEGNAARFDTDPFGGIPVGTMMADGWNRLVVVAPDRERIYLSDHDMDPSSTPLSFTDGARYFLNARFFQVPREIGRIVGVGFAPAFNFQDDLGPLVVFCERGTRAYSIQYPREEWIQRDISSTMLPTIGGCSHGGIVSRGNDMVFSDHNGRIQTFKVAISRRESVRIQPIDRGVHDVYAREDAALRRWRKAERFDDRMLSTVWPERVRRPYGFAVRHRGFIVLEEDTASERPFVWAGVWTGVKPVEITVVQVQQSSYQSPEERCFIVSLDDDGANRIYELDREQGDDLMPAPRRVPMTVFSRWMDWKTVFDPKRFLGASVHLGPIKGRVTVRGWWQTSGESPSDWFVHHDAGPGCIQPGCDGIGTLDAPSRPRLNLPAPPSPNAFFRARPILRISGRSSLREAAFHAETQSIGQGTGTSCVEPGSVSATRSCGPGIWDDAGDPSRPASVTVCQP